MESKFHDRWPENLPGKFYVDQACLDCQLCADTAPDFFTRNNVGGYYYVSRQPATKEEEALLWQTVEGCPCEAISGDGDKFDWKSGKPTVRDTLEVRKEKVEHKHCSHCVPPAKAWWQFWK